MREDQLLLTALVLAGVALFVRGMYLAWHPGGWMAAGVLLAVPAFFVLYGITRKRD